MPDHIPEEYKDLLERPIVAAFGTIQPDGSPQVTAVWFSYDGEYILINSILGRRKEKNVRARPEVSVLIIDPDNPYRTLEVRGIVAEITEEGGLDHINALAKRYLGREEWYTDPAKKAQETRVIFKIKPEKVLTH